MKTVQSNPCSHPPPKKIALKYTDCITDAIDLMHDDVLLINAPPSLTFTIQMCSQRTGIEKNTSMKICGKSVQKLHGIEA